MSIKCQTIISKLEQLAPKELAEDWDNIGLQIGDPRSDVEKILISLDLTKEVLEEAIKLGANMIVTHHPLIFKPLKNIRTDLSTGLLIKEIIKKDINIYTAHTNLDKANKGLNHILAEKLLLKDVEVLDPSEEDNYFKIVVFVPKGYEDDIKTAMGNANAGWIGNYSHCTFQTSGIGTFKPLEDSNAFIGKKGKIERVEEYKVETIVKEKNLSRTIRAIIKSHPYEEVAYDIYPLSNKGKKYGLGRIGIFEKELCFSEFIEHIKTTLKLNHIKIAGNKNKNINKVALCTGSGANLLHKALIKGADAFITGDVRYHEAQQAKDLGILVIDAGHFATEIIMMEGVKSFLDRELAKEKKYIQVIVSKSNKDFFETI